MKIARFRLTARRALADESGAVSIEYALLICFLAIAIIAALREIGGQVAYLLGLLIPGFMSSSGS